jgi:hypothetical protein
MIQILDVTNPLTNEIEHYRNMWRGDGKPSWWLGFTIKLLIYS